MKKPGKKTIKASATTATPTDYTTLVDEMIKACDIASCIQLAMRGMEGGGGVNIEKGYIDALLDDHIRHLNAIYSTIHQKSEAAA